MEKWLDRKLTTKEISIFGNSSHFEWRAALSDTILKRDHRTTIPAKFALIWFSLAYILGFSVKFFFQPFYTD
jgi:hypothetical protein